MFKYSINKDVKNVLWNSLIVGIVLAVVGQITQHIIPPLGIIMLYFALGCFIAVAVIWSILTLAVIKNSIFNDNEGDDT